MISLSQLEQYYIILYMKNSFDTHALTCYSNFMKFTISNSIYNLILVILENSTILFIIDLMFNDKILGEALTPLYFLSPHLYLDMLNELCPNECNMIFNGNTNSNSNTTESSNDKYHSFNNNTETQDIIFFGNKLYSLQNSYCIYSSKLIIAVIAILLILTLFLILLFFIKSRGKQNIGTMILLYTLTNTISLFTRPLFVIISIVLINRPIVYLYHSSSIIALYHTETVIYTFISLFFLIYAVIFAFIVMKYINNFFFFESLPYDYYSTTESLVLLIIKIVIGLKISYDKLLGLNEMSIMNLIIGVLMFVRVSCTIGTREYIINHVYLKNLTAFLSSFYSFYILLKLLNEFLKHLNTYTVINFTMELLLIIIVLLTFILILFKEKSEYIFRKKESFLIESMQFMHYINKHLLSTSQSAPYVKESKAKKEREGFIDNVIISHKIKCRMDECIICSEDIHNPNLKTLLLVLYQQFLQHEREYKEENEGCTLLIKLMFIKLIDERKIHRVTYIILKNLKNKNLSFGTWLKISYIYEKSLDELNQDLKGLLTIKYAEFNTELLKCIKNFEEILGFVKSRTEKVELVTDKTIIIGDIYNSIIADLYYLKKNKRIYFDPVNMLQIICILRLVFPRVVHNDLIENLDYNFIDFLEIVDQVFIDNINFSIRYDFNNRTWRIKKIPKIFIDMTKFKMSDLLDQSLEKIFPQILSKSIIKKLEEKTILSNMDDCRLEFKTVICDVETNARYVKFIIDIIPHLEENYMMFMQCHFHKRQLIIIDEFGTFVNGSQVLYEKIGINADIVSASKGRINMYTMFNLDKKQKLEDVTIVSIALEGVVNTTKKLFLLEAEGGEEGRVMGNGNGSGSGNGVLMNKDSATPNFLGSFIEKEAKGRHKQKVVVFLHLFSTEVINDVKYHIFNIRLSNPEDKKKNQKDSSGERDGIGNGNGNDEGKGKAGNKKSGARHTVTIKRISTSFSVLSNVNNGNGNDKEDNQLLHQQSTTGTGAGAGKAADKAKYNDYDLNNNNNSSLNNFNYYYAFLDSQHSMSMTMNYKANLNSANSSQTNSNNFDVFSYLYMKSIGSKAHSTKFSSFLYCIFFFNLLLVLYGLICISYIQSYSTSSLKLIQILEDFYTMKGRISKSTNVFLSFIKYQSNALSGNDTIYQNYIEAKYNLSNVPYDYMIQTILDYDLSKALSNISSFNTEAFKYLGEVTYNEKINYETYFIHLDPSGEYTIKKEKMKYVIDLFTLTTNQLANKNNVKVFFNVSYLDYEYKNKDILEYPSYMTLKGINPALLTKEDKLGFNDLINLYQHFFNYFSAYILTFNDIGDYLLSLTNSHFQGLHTVTRSLLIVILILNVIFVLICLSSILIYQNILKKEFRGLYGLSEDSINKLKEKFQYVKELIKWEQTPSSIYNKIRKMREEIEHAETEERLKKQRRDNRNANASHGNGNSNNSGNGNISLLPNQYQQQGTNNTNKDNANTANDTISVITTGSMGPSSDYLRFSGAVKGLFRSSTLKAKEQLKKLSKESLKQRASQELLNRLNFDFEMTQNFIVFIIFMTIFYIIFGIMSIIINDSNYFNIKESICFTNMYHNKFFTLFDFYSGVKLSMIVNHKAPYSIFNHSHTPHCEECVFDYLFNNSVLSSKISNKEFNDNQFNSLYVIEQRIEGDSICTAMYSELKSDLTAFIQAKGPNGMMESLLKLCKAIPILRSNSDSVFNNLLIIARQVYSNYLDSDAKWRLDYLTNNEFIEADILMTMFAHFYYEYITQNVVVLFNGSVIKNFYRLVIVIFIVNIFIDFFMILFIWLKIYRRIIASVNNVQLVTDSVSIV